MSAADSASILPLFASISVYSTISLHSGYLPSAPRRKHLIMYILPGYAITGKVN
jgi:hypothetical protein